MCPSVYSFTKPEYNAQRYIDLKAILEVTPYSELAAPGCSTHSNPSNILSIEKGRCSGLRVFNSMRGTGAPPLRRPFIQLQSSDNHLPLIISPSSFSTSYISPGLDIPIEHVGFHLHGSSGRPEGISPPSQDPELGTSPPSISTCKTTKPAEDP